MAKRVPRYPIREDKSELIEVHVAGLCFRRKSTRLELLIGQRTKARDLFPGYWECGGGQVRKNENFKEALERQYFEEFGLKVHVLQPLVPYEIQRGAKAKIPGIKFLCFIEHGSDDVELNPREFMECRWVTERMLNGTRFIPGARDDIRLAFQLAKSQWGTTRRSSTTRTWIGFNR